MHPFFVLYIVFWVVFISGFIVGVISAKSDKRGV